MIQFLEVDVHASEKSDVCRHFEFQHAFGVSINSHLVLDWLVLLFTLELMVDGPEFDRSLLVCRFDGVIEAPPVPVQAQNLARLEDLRALFVWETQLRLCLGAELIEQMKIVEAERYNIDRLLLRTNQRSALVLHKVKAHRAVHFPPVVLNCPSEESEATQSSHLESCTFVIAFHEKLLWQILNELIVVRTLRL